MEYVPESPMFEGPYIDLTPPSPPHRDEYNPGLTQFVPFVPSSGTLGSWGSKLKAPMVDVMDS